LRGGVALLQCRNMRTHLAAALILTLPLAAYSSCRQASTGRLKAETVGDLSRPLAERVDADAELVTACGEPGMTASGFEVLRRGPYLQRLGPTGTSVLWTAKVGTPLHVEVTTPDGEVVAEVGGERDAVGDSGAAEQSLARIEGLKPSTVYCYALSKGEGQPALFGRVGFRTAPERDALVASPVRFVVLGDSGEGSVDQAALVTQIKSVPFDFMLHAGDMAYESGTFQEFEANFFDMYHDVLPHFAMFPASGNHEYETNEAAPFRAVFDLPNNERWYSFDWGDVHFTILDTEQLDSDAQARWLTNDLAGTDQPWKVVAMHKPPYSSGSHGSELAARRAFSSTFERHGVDLVLTGHDHHYERMKPQNGVHYIVTGGGGAATYAVDPSDFTAFAEEVVHLVYVEVVGDQLTAHAIDGSGQEFDQLYIAKK